MKERDFKVSTERGSLQARELTPPRAGGAEAPVLVFLHEGLGSIGQWRDFPRRLAEATGFRTVVYDRPGFGASDPLDKPRDGRYLQREDIGSLASVLAACDIAHPVLIGHSDGGTISLLHAAAFPDRPLGVILEAAHVFTEDLTLAGIRDAVKAFDSGTLREGLARYHGAQTETMFRRWADDWLSPEFATWNVERELPKVRVPVLVIQGDEDQYGTLAQVDSITSKVSGPAERIIVPGCGHSPHLQAKEVVLRGMSDFIRKITAVRL